MRIPIAQLKIYDWQGPTTNMRLRVVADSHFLARDNDDTGVEVDAAPSVFREVDCTFATETIDGFPVKVLTAPALWLFSTNDALVNRKARYSTVLVQKNGREVHRIQNLQSFYLLKELLSVFNPVPWHEIIRSNNPAAPIPMNKETFSTDQILDLIGDGSILKGANAASPRMAFWSGPITIDGAIGVEYQNADGMLKFTQQNTAWNVLRIQESAAAPNSKVGATPALLSTHVVNEAGLSQRSIINDAATRNWNEVLKDGALGLQFKAYDSGDVLQGTSIFDPSGGVGISDGANPDFGYLYKASSAYHLGINAAGAGAPAATKEITFTTSGVGINKPTAIGAQLHVVSGAAGRIGFLIDTASSPSQPIAILRNNTSQRFLFDHDARAEFGLQSVVKGRLTFAVANNTNKTSVEAADTPASNVIYKMPAADPAGGQLLRTLSFAGGVAVLEWVNPTAGGDVSSDIGSVVDNTLTRFNGTTGKIITSSAIIVADTSGSFTVPDGWTLTDASAASINLATPAGSAGIINLTTPATAVNGFSFNLVAGSQTQSSSLVKSLRLFSTFNQTSTAGSDSLSIERTETALGSGQHNFIRGLSGAAGSTVRFRIDNLGNYFFGATGGFIGDANGDKYLSFVTNASPAVNNLEIGNAVAASAPFFRAVGSDTNIPLELIGKGTGRVLVTGSGGIQMTNSGTPSVRFTNTTASKTFIQVVSTSGVFVLGEDLVNNAIQIAPTTGVVSFEAIPVGPAATPTLDNQLARKKYTDDRKYSWSTSFFILDPSSATLSSLDFGEIIIPAGGTYTITQCKVAYVGGSHTTGGSVSFVVQQQGVGTVATLTLDNTNNAVNTVYVNNIGDVNVAENVLLGVVVSARSGTVTERNVAVTIEGFRTGFN